MKVQAITTLAIGPISVAASVAVWTIVSPVHAFVVPVACVPVSIATALDLKNVRNLTFIFLAAQVVVMLVLALAAG